MRHLTAQRHLIDVIYIILIPAVIVMSIWYTNRTTAEAVQKANATALREAREASCESSNEFRRFMSSYLHSQVGVPVSDIAGFDRLDPPTRALVLALAPIVDAGRENRTQKAEQYDRDFPIQDCERVASLPPTPDPIPASTSTTNP